MLTRKQALDQAIGRSGLTQKEICKRAMISEPTLTKKLKEPGLFKLSEITRLDKVLHFTDDEIIAIARGGYDKWF